MLTRMSDSSEHDPRAPVWADGSGEGPGVLAGLPRTRPQRASARRVAARAAKPSSTPTAARTTATRKARTTAARQATTPARQARKPQPINGRGSGKESVPKQGFEAEPDSLRGSVAPPGGAELVASAAELAGELAKAGVNTGVRVLKDFLSRLPG